MAKTARDVPKVIEDNSTRWVCLSIKERYANREYFPEVKRELADILGPESQILMIGDDMGADQFENALEIYVFVKCPDIYLHKRALMDSKYIRNVLNSFSDIRFIDQSEIDVIQNNWKDKIEEERGIIRFGDVVLVKSGIFENLTGIVTGKRQEDEYEVMFRLWSGSRTGVLQSNNLITQTNIFTHMRLPVYEL